MTNREKFDYALFAIIYFITILLFIIGIVLGGYYSLCCIIVGLAAGLFGTTLIFIGPIHTAHKIYAAYPPRAKYEELSSKEGYCKLENVSENYLIPLICTEDHRFYRHKGIVADSIINALMNNIKNIKTNVKPIGGSTITQQLIKNIYLSPKVSMKRKLIEMVMTQRIEKELTKSEILELYINVIYYGNGQYGITNASKYYYGVKPKDLNFLQGASLASILPCPDKYNEKNNPELFRKARQITLKRTVEQSHWTFETLANKFINKC